MSLNKWIDEEDVYIYNVIHFSAMRKKEGNPAFCDNMDGPWGYKAEWNKPTKEGQTPHGITYTRYLKRKERKSNSETESRKVFAREWGVGEIRRRGNEYNLSAITLIIFEDLMSIKLKQKRNPKLSTSSKTSSLKNWRGQEEPKEAWHDGSPLCVS